MAVGTEVLVWAIVAASGTAVGTFVGADISTTGAGVGVADAGAATATTITGVAVGAPATEKLPVSCSTLTS